MDEGFPITQLPSDVVISSILNPELHQEGSEQFFYQIQQLNKHFRRICNSRKVRSNINLTKHEVFDSTKDFRYVQFILDCADGGNKYACLLYGLSISFCFGQPKEGLKYLSTITRDYQAAEYASAVLKMEGTHTRVEGIATMTKMRTTPIEDYIDNSRIRLLQMFHPGLHFIRPQKEMAYNCKRGAKCHKKHNTSATVDGELITIGCADKFTAAIEYNIFENAFKTYHQLI